MVPQARLHHPIPHQRCRFHSGSGLRRCFHQEDLRGRFSAASHQLCGDVPHCECCCFKLLRQLYTGSFAVISSCYCQQLLQFKHNAFRCCSIHAAKSCMIAYQLPWYMRSYSELYSLDPKALSNPETSKPQTSSLYWKSNRLGTVKNALLTS